MARRAVALLIAMAVKKPILPQGSNFVGRHSCWCYHCSDHGAMAFKDSLPFPLPRTALSPARNRWNLTNTVPATRGHASKSVTGGISLMLLVSSRSLTTSLVSGSSLSTLPQFSRVISDNRYQRWSSNISITRTRRSLLILISTLRSNGRRASYWCKDPGGGTPTISDNSLNTVNLLVERYVEIAATCILNQTNRQPGIFWKKVI